MDIHCPQNITITTCSNSATVPFTATANNLCNPAVPPTLVCTPASGSSFPVGSTTVTCTATDPLTGLTATCSFQVTVVRDTTPPQITCPANISVTSPTTAGVPVTYTATATDAVDPSPTVVCVPPSGSVFTPGVTTVTCTATDRCGNQSTCSFTVTVTSAACLQIQCPQNISITTCSNSATVPFTATANNLCNPAVPPTLVCTPASGSSFPVGSTTVTCTATDPLTGLTATCSFQVTVVRDTTPPQITCPGNISVTSPTTAGVPVTYTATATDAVDPSPTVVCVPPSGSVFAPGVTTVTCTATDRCGNKSICSFFVTVQTENCLLFPIRSKIHFIGFQGTNACYIFALTFQNFSGVPVRYVILDGIQDCVNFSPPVVDLTQPA